MLKQLKLFIRFFIHIAIGKFKTKKWLDWMSRQNNSEPLSSFQFKMFSQSGEDGILQRLIHLHDLKCKSFLEIGSGNRIQCIGSNLAFMFGYRGIYVDAGSFNDNAAVNLLYAIFTKKGAIVSSNKFITSENVNELAAQWKKQIDVDNFDVFMIDINGNDYHVLKTVLGSIRPKIMCVEYNASIPVEEALTIPYIPDFDRDNYSETGLYHGASLAAFAKLCSQNGYALVGTDPSGVNAFFIDRKLLKDKNAELSVEQAFTLSRYRKHLGDVHKQFSLVKQLEWQKV